MRDRVRIDQHGEHLALCVGSGTLRRVQRIVRIMYRYADAERHVRGQWRGDRSRQQMPDTQTIDYPIMQCVKWYLM